VDVRGRSSLAERSGNARDCIQIYPDSLGRVFARPSAIDQFIERGEYFRVVRDLQSVRAGWVENPLRIDAQIQVALLLEPIILLLELVALRRQFCHVTPSC